MGRIADRLAELGLELPAVFSAPPGVEFKFDLVHVSGRHAYVSGHLPTDGAEVLMVIKTRRPKVDALVARIKALHSYTVPEVVAMDVVAGNPDYLAWVAESVPR